MKLKIFNKLSKKDLLEFKKFADVHWGERYDTEEEVKLNFFDTPEFVISAYLDEKLVGIQPVFMRKIKFQSIDFVLGGLGGLVTHKDYRHKGIASKLLKTAVGEMKKCKYEISILCTDIEKLGFLYERYGFRPLNKPYYYIDKLGSKKEELGGMIAPICNSELYNKILNTNEILNIGTSNI